MHRPVEKLGKVGTTVWGKNRHGQTCYELVIPTNPRTEAQQANRHHFGGVGSTWRLRTDPQRALWEADARNYRTHGRPGSSAALTGFQRYMQVNAPRASQGLPLLEVPPLAFSLQPLAFPSRLLHASPPPRVPMQYRTNAVVTRFPHAWGPLDPRLPRRSGTKAGAAPLHARWWSRWGGRAASFHWLTFLATPANSVFKLGSGESEK